LLGLGQNHKKTNAYFHGWLFEEVANRRVKGHTGYPLVGFFRPAGCAPFEPQDAMGDAASAGFGGRVTPADQHIHTVDVFAGGDADNYRQLLLESGMSLEDANAIIAVEMAGSDDYFVGSDSARFFLNAHMPVVTSYVVCVDASISPPRIMVTLLVVVSEELESLVAQLARVLRDDAASSGQTGANAGQLAQALACPGFPLAKHVTPRMAAQIIPFLLGPGLGPSLTREDRGDY
jgi:hypothetical protein